MPNLSRVRINSFRTFSFIYFPFLWILLGTTAIYSLLSYFLLPYLSFLSDSIANLLLPGLFVSAGYIFFYKEKINSIPKLNSDNFRAFFFVLLCTVPAALVFQHVIVDLSIRKHKEARYQEISTQHGIHQYYLEPSLHLGPGPIGMHPRYYTSYNKNAPDDSHYEVFFVRLVKHDGKSLFWFGKKYEHVVRRDRSPNADRDLVFNKTIQKSITDFTEFFTTEKIKVLEWNRQQDDYQYFEKAAQESNENSKFPILTEPESRQPIEGKVRMSLAIFAAGQLIWIIVCALVRVDEDIIDDHEKLSVVEKLKQRALELIRTFSWFIPRKGYWITPLLVDINIAVYVTLGLLGVSMMNPSGRDLIAYGSNYSPLVLQGEVWRLLTAGFLHFGFIHILMNMVALGFSGSMLEQVLGGFRFLILYLFSVLGCSIASLYWHHPGNSAGASGGVFGILGAMLLYAVFRIGDQSNRVMFFITFIIFGLVSLLTGLVSWSHSDMAGHLGGMVAGMIVGSLFIPVVRKSKEVSM